MNEHLEKFIQRLDSFKEYNDNWNSYGAKPISVPLIETCKGVLKTLIDNEVVPTFIFPTDESIIFEIIRNHDSRCMLEVFEDDDIVLVLISKFEEPDAYIDYKLNGILPAITKLKEWMKNEQSDKKDSNG